MPEQSTQPEFAVYPLLKSATVAIRDTKCRGTCRSLSQEEFTTTTQIVFPYRGVFIRHLGRDRTVAEANQVLFFNRQEAYRVSHPVEGGDGSLTFDVDESQLYELVRPSLLHRGHRIAFRHRRLRIDSEAQRLVAMLRHRLRAKAMEPLEAELISITLLQCTLGMRGAHAPGGTAGHQKLADRAKLVLASNPMRRWTLAEIAAEVRTSPVYLTQIFQEVEGLPLYKYQLQLRLARAAYLLPRYKDLTTMALDLGFSSHSHLSAAFRRLYGCSPSAFKRSTIGHWS